MRSSSLTDLDNNHYPGQRSINLEPHARIGYRFVLAESANLREQNRRSGAACDTSDAV